MNKHNENCLLKASETAYLKHAEKGTCKKLDQKFTEFFLDTERKNKTGKDNLELDLSGQIQILRFVRHLSVFSINISKRISLLNRWPRFCSIHQKYNLNPNSYYWWVLYYCNLFMAKISEWKLWGVCLYLCVCIVEVWYCQY